jgi:L-fuculose-phosphate aldolase
MVHIKKLVDVCHRLYEKEFVAATDGNVSLRLPNGHILTTRSGVNKGAVTLKDLVEVTVEGEKISGKSRQRTFKPSTEIGMHLFIYRRRPDVRAIVHAHPPYATGFATARIPMDRFVFPEVIVGLGEIPLAEYATPSTQEVPESLTPYVKTHDAILLANHGVVSMGGDVWDAYFKLEKVEHAAHTIFVARLLGGVNELSPLEIKKLQSVSLGSWGKKIPSTIISRIIRTHKRKHKR